MRIWAAYFKQLLNGKGAASCLKLPSSVGREVDVYGYDRKKWNQQCTR